MFVFFLPKINPLLPLCLIYSNFTGLVLIWIEYDALGPAALLLRPHGILGVTPWSAFNTYLFLFSSPAAGLFIQGVVRRLCFFAGFHLFSSPAAPSSPKGYNSFVLFPLSRLVDYQHHGRRRPLPSAPGRLPPPQIFASCHSHTHIERRELRTSRLCFLPAAAALCRPRQITSGAAISVPCLTPPLPDATTTMGSCGLMTKVKEICPRGNNKVIIYFLIS